MSDWCSGERCNKCKPLPGCWNIEQANRVAALEVDIAAMTRAHGVAVRIHIAETQAAEQLRADLAAAQAEVATLREQLQRLAKMSPNNAKYLGIRIDAAIDAAKEIGNG